MNPGCRVQDQLKTNEPTAPYIIGRCTPFQWLITVYSVAMVDTVAHRWNGWHPSTQSQWLRPLYSVAWLTPFYSVAMLDTVILRCNGWHRSTPLQWLIPFYSVAMVDTVLLRWNDWHRSTSLQWLTPFYSVAMLDTVVLRCNGWHRCTSLQWLMIIIIIPGQFVRHPKWWFGHHIKGALTF